MSGATDRAAVNCDPPAPAAQTNAESKRYTRLRLVKFLDDLDARHGKPSDAVRDEVVADAQCIFRR